MPRPDRVPTDEIGTTVVFLIVLIAVLLMLRSGAATGMIDRVITQHADQRIPIVSPM
jgi:hypothetical protein